MAQKLSEFTVDINAGAVDGTTVGATVASTVNTTELSINGTAVTATAAELNYVDGVTSAIQTQIDAKAPLADPTFTGVVNGALNGTLGATTPASIVGTTGTFSSSLQNTGDFTNVTPAATANAAVFGAITGLSNGYRIASDASNDIVYTWSDGAGNTVITLSASGNLILASGQLNISTTSTPASAAAAGTTGDIAWDSSYVYVCTATNTWKRTAIATW